MTKDDEPDDPQLRSLRAVWLSLPDEEPPTRGLDALMAAARAKAEVLATPPWWKRLLHGITRPPVLALASIMVLIGGAVLISNHKSADEAMPTLGQPAKDVSMPPRSAGSAELRREGPAEEKKADTIAAPKVPVTQEPPPPVHHAPPRHVTTPSTPRADPPRDTTTTTTKRPSGGGTAPGFDPGEAAADRELETDVKDDSKATTRAPGRVMVDQLLAQCRSAANRGDCENAKVIARRIAAQDAAYYKEHVAPDATIQKCLAAQ